jgi:tetratricopeptide (TPR) repeat protein
MDENPRISSPNVQDNANKTTETRITGFDLNNISINEIVNIDKSYLDELDPKFKNSIEEFVKLLNIHLSEIPVTNEQKILFEKQIEGIVTEIKNIPSCKKTQNNLPINSEKLSNENNRDPIACDGRALETEPQDADAYNNKGLSLYNLGDNNGAIACYDRALEIEPRFACAHYNKGIILSAIGDHNGAIACYDKALETEPQDGDIHYNKGLSLASIEKHTEAIACYDKALEINPQNADAYNNKGLSLHRLGHSKEAIACYDKALLINPPLRTRI